MSRLVVNQLQASNPTTNLISVAAGDTVYSPGSVVQMVNTTIYTPTSVSLPANAVANTNIPDFACTITPKSASSRIFVQVRWFGELNPQSQIINTMFGLKQNGTPVGVNPNTTAGNAAGISMAALSYDAGDSASTPEMMFFDFYATPATTAAVTYQVYANCTSTASTLYTNRTVTVSSPGYEYGSSTITLWEIAQ
jgi:hypothetical protein